jgi:hypothetical protein
VKLKLKTGEHIRIQTDASAPVMVYIEHGVVHVTAQPKFQPTRVVIADKRARVERAGNGL